MSYHAKNGRVAKIGNGRSARTIIFATFLYANTSTVQPWEEDKGGGAFYVRVVGSDRQGSINGVALVVRDHRLRFRHDSREAVA